MGARLGERDLADLYRRHVPGAVRLAYLMTGDPMLAEDLAQDAFVRLTGRFAHIRNPDAFPAYLRRTVVNLVKNHYRRSKLERSHLESLGGEAHTSVEELPAGVDAEALLQALLELPYRQRAAIVLRYYEDLPESRVAELLGCRPGTVKSLVSRGFAAMRTAMGRELERNHE
jgi:RNA polymerase sigma-70 factor (sigma-E family)